jgi:hypothetical protein
MVRSTIVLGLLLAVGSVTTVLADTTSLQSILTNANGVQTTDFTGYNTGAFNTTTGLGTLTFLYNPGPGVYFFDVFFDHQLSLPFFNEFGTKLGSAAAGQTWEIGDSFGSNIYSDVQAGVLTNANTLPGQTSNFNNACVGLTCNGDFAAALGFGFTLGAGQKELITLNVSHTDPGSGLRLEDTHPQDAANPNGGGNLFISGSAVACTVDQCGAPPPPTPEPASAVLFGSGLAILLIAFRRRLAVKL